MTISNNIVLIFAFCATSVALKHQSDDAAVKKVMQKYFKNIPEVESKYVIDEGLSKTISNYFNGKISAFPLFKVSITLDKTPIKIPWVVQTEPKNVLPLKKKYQYAKVGKPINRDY